MTTLITPARALDPLRIERDFTMINLADYIRYAQGDAVFSVQNPRDDILTIEIERYPIRWPLETYLRIEKSPIQAFRLFATDGRELAADWRTPHLLTITQAPQSVQTYAFDGRPGPLWHIWMWGEGQRERYLRNARSFWVIAIAAGGVVTFLALIRLLWNRPLRGGRLLGLAASLTATAGLLKIDLMLPSATVSVLWSAMPLRPDDLLLALLALNFALLLSAHRAPYTRHLAWRPFWRTGIWFATLALIAGSGIWAGAVLYGPFLGFITADLMALLWLGAGFVASFTVLLSPNRLGPSRLPTRG